MTIAPPEDTVQALLEATRALIAMKAKRGTLAAEKEVLTFAQKLAALMPETDLEPELTLADHFAARRKDK